MKSEKYNHLVNITRRNRLTYKEQTSGYQWGEGRGNKGVEEREAQTTECEAGLETYCATLRI